jgi:phosphatidylserine synthase 2
MPLRSLAVLHSSFLFHSCRCWWDQWILDVGVSNALGIVIGCKLAGYLEMKEYKWGSYGSIPSYLGKAKRTMMQFTPASWTKVEWKPTSSLKRVFAVQVLIVCMHIEELNAFFLKYILWVPPECKLNCTNAYTLNQRLLQPQRTCSLQIGRSFFSVRAASCPFSFLVLLSSVVRLIIWAFVGVPSLRQIYSYISDPHCKRIGHQTFLSLVVLLTELIVIVKFGEGEFPNPMPHNIRVGLAAFLAIYGAGLALIMLRTRGSGGSSGSGSGSGSATPNAGSPVKKGQ